MLILDQVASVYRLTTQSNKDSYAETPVVADIPIGVVPADAELLLLYPGSSQYQQFQIFTEDMTEFQTGDKFVTDTGEYILRHVPARFALDLGLNYQWFMGEQAQ